MARVERGIYCMHHIHRTLLPRFRSRESKNDQKLQRCQKHCSYSSISSGTYFLVFSPAWTNTYTLEREFSPKWHNRTIALCSLVPLFPATSFFFPICIELTLLSSGLSRMLQAELFLLLTSNRWGYKSSSASPQSVGGEGGRNSCVEW